MSRWYVVFDSFFFVFLGLTYCIVFIFNWEKARSCCAAFNLLFCFRNKRSQKYKYSVFVKYIFSGMPLFLRPSSFWHNIWLIIQPLFFVKFGKTFVGFQGQAWLMRKVYKVSSGMSSVLWEVLMVGLLYAVSLCLGWLSCWNPKQCPSLNRLAELNCHA